ncbi:MAG TPA: PLD nuclease N-terminal domain-containing protein [Verrucomicrobiae bacterium]|nr:PLD nuclease N-terminal domain-containing protein [Verrucomicrobiae bacterium]
MNAPDIEKLLIDGPDPAQQDTQFAEFAWFTVELVTAIAVVALAVGALRSLAMSRVKPDHKVVWMIVILALPIVGPCLYYAAGKKVLRR